MRKARKEIKNLCSNNFEVLHISQHASRDRKGILRSIIFNKTARLHIASWLKYMWKWRSEFFAEICIE